MIKVNPLLYVKQCQKFDFNLRRDHKKFLACDYESVDEKSLS